MANKQTCIRSLQEVEGSMDSVRCPGSASPRSEPRELCLGLLWGNELLDAIVVQHLEPLMDPVVCHDLALQHHCSGIHGTSRESLENALLQMPGLEQDGLLPR